MISFAQINTGIGEVAEECGEGANCATIDWWMIVTRSVILFIILALVAYGIYRLFRKWR